MTMIPQMRYKAVEAPSVNIENSLISEFQKLDLTLNEARIAVHLLTFGRASAKDISLHTGIQRTETYHHISGLLAKGIVLSTFDRPQKYYSLPLEEVVDCLLQSKRNALESFESKKKEYMGMLDALVSTRVIRHDDKKSYHVVMGENAINSRITRMLAVAQEEVMLLLTDKSMGRLYHAGIMDKLTELTARNSKVKLRTRKDPDGYLNGKKRKMTCSTIKNELPASFVLVDGREVIIILEEDQAKKPEVCAFYTNNLILVSLFRFLFENVA